MVYLTWDDFFLAAYICLQISWFFLTTEYTTLWKCTTFSSSEGHLCCVQFLAIPGKRKQTRFCGWTEGRWGQEQKSSSWEKRDRESEYWERALELGNICRWCGFLESGKVLDSMRVTLMRPLSSGGYKVWLGRVCSQSGKASSGRTGLHLVELFGERFYLET